MRLAGFIGLIKQLHAATSRLCGLDLRFRKTKASGTIRRFIQAFQSTCQLRVSGIIRVTDRNQCVRFFQEGFDQVIKFLNLFRKIGGQIDRLGGITL